MEQTGISLEQVKRKNRAYILRTINDEGPISRKDIAAKLQLTAASLTQTCALMIEEGLICETGTSKEDKGPGRKKVLVDINYDFRICYCIVIEPEKTAIAITNLKGDLKAFKRIRTIKDISAEEYLEKIARICLELKNEAGAGEITLAGVCISGLVDRNKKTSVHAYGIWEGEVEIGRILGEKLGCEVVLENNVTAFALAELYFGLGKKNDNLFFVKWGPGIGSAIITEKKIYEGELKKAAEIGHFIIEKDGERCSCGRRGCLETKLSYTAIRRSISKIYSKETTPELYKLTCGDINNITEDLSFDLFADCDEPVKDIMAKSINLFSLVITNSMTILSPSKVVLCGPVFKSVFLREKVIEGCTYFDPGYNSDNIIHTALADKEDYIGAAALCAKEVLFGE